MFTFGDKCIIIYFCLIIFINEFDFLFLFDSYSTLLFRCHIYWLPKESPLIFLSRWTRLLNRRLRDMSSCGCFYGLWSWILVDGWWSIKNFLRHFLCIMNLLFILISFFKVESPKMLLIPLIIAHGASIFTKWDEFLLSFNRLIVPFLVLRMNILHVVAFRVLKTTHRLLRRVIAHRGCQVEQRRWLCSELGPSHVEFAFLHLLTLIVKTLPFHLV